MRALLIGSSAITVFCACVESGSTLPVVSEQCIADAVSYNRTISEEFRHPTERPAGKPAPVQVAPELVEGRRLSGTTMIIPNDGTKEEMANRGVIETTASFELCLDAAGVPVSARRMSSTCFPRYDETIRTTMLTWRYSPYTIDGVATEVCTGVNFLYKQSARRRR